MAGPGAPVDGSRIGMIFALPAGPLVDDRRTTANRGAGNRQAMEYRMHAAWTTVIDVGGGMGLGAAKL